MGKTNFLSKLQYISVVLWLKKDKAVHQEFATKVV